MCRHKREFVEKRKCQSPRDIWEMIVTWCADCGKKLKEVKCQEL